MERGDLPAHYAPLEPSIADAYLPQMERALILETVEMLREVLHKAAEIGWMASGVQTFSRFFPDSDDDQKLYDALSEASGLEDVSDFSLAIAYLFNQSPANMTPLGVEAFAARHPDMPEVSKALVDITKPIEDPPGFKEWVAQGMPEVPE